MPLLRHSEKRLAANRANAQKSTGPRTPEGKARSSQNACKHHLYARAHIIPPAWHDAIAAKVIEATAELSADPRRRQLHAAYLYHELWACELDNLADLCFFHASPRAIIYSPLAHAIRKRRKYVYRRIVQAEKAICHYETPRARIAPHKYRQPKTMAAAAGLTSPSAERTPISHKTQDRYAAPHLPAHPVHDSKVPTPITLQVNGAPRTASAPESITLLDFLRDHLHLTGAKYGCGEGACGACTVLIENRPVQSCTVSAASVQNRKITTIEGLAQNAKLHPVQQAFLDAEAFQCGYCTPAMILAAAALLNENPNPPTALIREKLEGHLCRCGTYPRIVEAVRLAAKLEAARAQ